jgi:hypothetical protein
LIPAISEAAPATAIVDGKFLGWLVPVAFSSEVDTGSREENPSKQKIRAAVLIQSEPMKL